MKIKFQGLGILLSVISLIFFASINHGYSITQNYRFGFHEKESDSKPLVSDWEGHFAKEGLVERRFGTAEITDEEKIPTDALAFGLFVSSQNSVRFVFLKAALGCRLFKTKDFPVLYHNLRI
jgi:hypothetical protein